VRDEAISRRLGKIAGLCAADVARESSRHHQACDNLKAKDMRRAPIEERKTA